MLLTINITYLLTYLNDFDFCFDYTVRFKVIDTDYTTTAVVYSCYGLTDDGRCRHQLEQVDILSRQPAELSRLARSRVYDVVSDRLCVDIYDFVKSARGQHETRIGLWGIFELYSIGGNLEGNRRGLSRKREVEETELFVPPPQYFVNINMLIV